MKNIITALLIIVSANVYSIETVNSCDVYLFNYDMSTISVIPKNCLDFQGEINQRHMNPDFILQHLKPEVCADGFVLSERKPNTALSGAVGALELHLSLNHICKK